jgi:uncharacterized RDD family membrane protein YckC
MKCPKCGYLGFEDVDRCRNCGYEFSLIWPPAEPELPIRSQGGTPTALDDLPLAGSTSAAPALDTKAEVLPEALEWATGDAGIPDLPLFDATSGDDEPLISKASAPRPPLAVRRATPEVPRLRDDTSRAPLFEFETDGARRRIPPGVPAALHHAAESSSAVHDDANLPAGWIARSMALLIDLVIFAAIDSLVVYFTMQICGLRLADLSILPKGPLTAFLIVQNGGYLVTFTLGGQTLGKMAMGIRVVPTSTSGPLDLGRSILRTIIWITLAVPAGLGFLTALFSHDRRGLHDRCAGTRVVRTA